MIISKYQKEILNGLMLGDGNLFKSKNAYGSILSMSRQIRDSGYNWFLYDALKEFFNFGPKYHGIFDQRTQKLYDCHRMNTKCVKEFNPIYFRWYTPKKVIPQDFSIEELTPLTCAIWFCDDGCVISKPNSKRLSLKISSHGFSYEDNLRLCDMLNYKFPGSYFSLREDNKKYYIGSADFGTKEFIKYINYYIPLSMDRKIKWSSFHMSIDNQMPQLKNRGKFCFNQREKLIINELLKHKLITIKQVAININWINQNGKPGTAIGRYFDKYVSYGWIEKIGTHNWIKFRITEKGQEELKNSINLQSS